MIIFSPLTVGLGIAALILYKQVICMLNTPIGTCPLTETAALTWVSVAIWAPIPIFVNGLGAVWIANRPQANPGWLCLLSFFNTVAFGPAIVVITALQLGLNKYPGAPDNLPPIVPTVLKMPYLAAFGIDIAIAIVGGVLWLHALAVLYLNCCCTSCLKEPMAKGTPTPNSADADRVVNVDQPKTPAVLEQGSDDADRMNMWSAYRWMNNGGGAAMQPATRTNYYAVGATPTRCAPGGYSGGYSGVAGPYGPGPRNVLAGGGPAVARW